VRRKRCRFFSYIVSEEEGRRRKGEEGRVPDARTFRLQGQGGGEKEKERINNALSLSICVGGRGKDLHKEEPAISPDIRKRKKGRGKKDLSYRIF